jgi:hypothetical protein
MSFFNKTFGVPLSIVHRKKTKLREFFNCLPSTLTEKYAQLVAADVSRDPNAKVHRVGRQTIKWYFKYEPVKGFEIPHYINLTLTNDEEEDYDNRVWVTLPGRWTPCLFCQQNTHWDSKCPTRAEKQAKRPTLDPLRRKPEEAQLILETPTTTQETRKQVQSSRRNYKKVPNTLPL